MGRPQATLDTASLGTSISIRLPNGQLVPMTLHKFDQMSKVYHAASTQTGAKESLVRIKFTGKTLQRTQTVNALGVMAGMVLKAEVISERTLDLTVKVEGAADVQLQVMNTSSVSSLMYRLKNQGYAGRYRLYFGSKEIGQGTEDVLYDLKIGNNSTLTARPAGDESLSTKQCQSAANVADSIKVEENEITPEFSADGKAVEIVFSFDTTGSMYGVLSEVRQNLRDIVDRLINDIPNIRIGLIAHGDYCDYRDYVTKTHDLSNDAQSLKKFAMDVPATGGGDAPEAYELVLRKAQQFDWSENSAKALIVIGDCQPHPPSMTDEEIYWQTELDLLCGLGIKVYGVQALNNSSATPFYKELADRSNGAYVKFSNFSLIRDMFLAVCYNEASEDQLDEFRTQLQADGELSEQKEQIFEQLKEQQQAVKEDRAAEILD